MKPTLRLTFLLAFLWLAQSGKAQYCSPGITTTGIYIGGANFTNVGGPNYNTAGLFTSEGYVDRSASSSGTVTRNCTKGYAFNLQSCGNQGAKSFNFRVYADWNQDNDFDDANEIAYEVNNTIVNGNCAFFSSTVFINVPSTANTGTIRLRWAVREGGTATACGSYTGEVEDYSITVAANTAPVVDNSGEPVLNPLIETQTSNDGMPVSRFITTTEPTVTLITESDPCSADKIGIAVTGTSGTNGTWQYKTSGSWTDIGSVSGTNALVLAGTDRIRFVPTTTGTPTITFRAWDKTVSSSGQYYNITSTGGTSAFSSAEETASLEVYSSASAADDITVYMPTYSASAYNIITSAFSPSSGIFKQPESITSDGTDGYGQDIVLDQANGKIYWIGGTDGLSLMRSDLDGSNVTTLITGTFGWPTGLAIGGSKLFIADYGAAIYSADLDGTNLTAITGGAGQASDIGDLTDIEYDGGNIYYMNQPSYTGDYKMFQADADGTNTVELLSTPNYVYGLDVVNGNLYWTENDGSASYLQTRAISGGITTTLTTESGYVYDLMASPSDSKIYFTEAPASGNNYTLNSIPLAGGTATQELALENLQYSLVFNRNFSTLPVHFLTIKAWPQGSSNIVEWNIAEEENVSYYIVERSADGNNFTDAGTVNANHSSRYKWPDAQPLSGNNYYRVRAVDIDGKKLYSAIVLVSKNGKDKNITAYPTVVNNGQFALRMQNMDAGNYQLQVISNTGQSVYTQRITHSGGGSVQNIQLPANLGKGVYRVRVTGNNESYTNSILIR